jgi:hypothetical protein
MGDTYDSAAEAEADRAQQKVLIAALSAWDRALRRDECGAWCVSGERGSIHTWGDGKTWALYALAGRSYADRCSGFLKNMIGCSAPRPR